MIILHMDRPDFENDIRAILMSFFFGEKIVTDAQLAKMKEEEKVFSHEFSFSCRGSKAEISVRKIPDPVQAAGRTEVIPAGPEGQGPAKAGKAETKATDQNETKAGDSACLVFDWPSDDKRAGRDALKTQMYRMLSSYTGRTLPWGTLTGVRPTKIPMELLERGASIPEAAAHMREKYLVSEEKSLLASKVAQKELAIIKKLYADSSRDAASTGAVNGTVDAASAGAMNVTIDASSAGSVNDAEAGSLSLVSDGSGYVPGQQFPGFSLYLGIPFCPTICAYCSFSSYPIKAWAGKVEDYLGALFQEIKSMPEQMVRPATFYMGGGTPTSLSADQLDRVLTCLEERFDMAGCGEKTVEAGRPDSITRDKLKVMKKHGIDRISINPQTMNQATLDLIGRRHSVDQIKEAFAMAREEGFHNINMDLIAGLPGETSFHMENTMKQVVSLDPESITVHSLALKRAAFLNQNRELFPVAGADEVNRMIGISRDYASQAGMEPYYLYRQKNIAGNLENVGYSKKGCECSYNIIIMEEIQSIAALGSGSISKRVYPGYRIERCANVKSVDDYIGRIDEMIDRKRQLFL